MRAAIEEATRNGEDVTDGERFLYQLNKSLYKYNNSKLDRELVDKLREYSQKIHDKRRQAKAPQTAPTVPRKEKAAEVHKPPAKLSGSPSDVIEEDNESQESSLARYGPPRKPARVKPSHLKNLNAALSAAFLGKVLEIVIMSN